MGEYKLTYSAINDLSNIWNYTFDLWSEKQADKYYKELLLDCKRIAENQFLGRNYEGITKSLFGRRSKKHIIFYRIIREDLVEITRILHQRMDLKKHLEK